MNITLAQREALDVVKDMIDKSNTDVPEFGSKIITLILGILNVDCRVEHSTIDITDITDIDDGKITPIIPDNGNDGIQINIPDWVKNIPPSTPDRITPEPCPFPPQVWYKQEPEPIQTDKQEDINYVAEVTHTGGKNGIVYVSNTADVRYTEDKNCITTTRDVSDCTTYTGDFRDVQTSFNNK